MSTSIEALGSGEQGTVAAVTSPNLIHPEAAHLTYGELFGRYAMSDFGVHHATQTVRYARYYGYDREQMLADLGDDIHPLRHMTYTEENIFRLLALHQQTTSGAEPFSSIQIVAGRLGALLHDTGECELPELAKACDVEAVGDVSYNDKTDDHDKAETIIREYIFSMLFDDVPDEIMELVEDTIANKKGTLLREGFNLSEHIGYLMTGVQAGRVALSILETGDETHEDRYKQLRKLALKVAPVHFDHVGEHGKAFPFADVTRENLAPEVEKIQSVLSDQ